MIYTYIELSNPNGKMIMVENYGNLSILCREKIYTNQDIMLKYKKPSERTTKARLYEEILETCRTKLKWECGNIVILRKEIKKSKKRCK
jgi:hypothetical protein